MYAKLAKLLKANHKFENGVWFTDYSNIPGFRILSSTTNGDGGIGNYRGKRVYFAYYYSRQKFKVE